MILLHNISIQFGGKYQSKNESSSLVTLCKGSSTREPAAIVGFPACGIATNFSGQASGADLKESFLVTFSDLRQKKLENPLILAGSRVRFLYVTVDQRNRVTRELLRQPCNEKTC